MKLQITGVIFVFVDKWDYISAFHFAIITGPAQMLTEYPYYHMTEMLSICNSFPKPCPTVFRRHVGFETQIHVTFLEIVLISH